MEGLGDISKAMQALSLVSKSFKGTGSSAGEGAFFSKASVNTLSAQLAFAEGLEALDRWSSSRERRLDRIAVSLQESMVPLPADDAVGTIRVCAQLYGVVAEAVLEGVAASNVAFGPDARSAVSSVVSPSDVRVLAASSSGNDAGAVGAWLTDATRLVCGTLVFAAEEDASNTQQQHERSSVPSQGPTQQAAKLLREGRAIALELRGCAGPIAAFIRHCDSIMCREIGASLDSSGAAAATAATAADGSQPRCSIGIELANRQQALIHVHELTRIVTALVRALEKASAVLESNCAAVKSLLSAAIRSGPPRKSDIFPCFERVAEAWLCVSSVAADMAIVGRMLQSLRRYLPAASVPGGVSHALSNGRALAKPAERAAAYAAVTRRLESITTTANGASPAAGSVQIVRSEAWEAAAPKTRVAIAYGGFCPVLLCAHAHVPSSRSQLGIALRPSVPSSSIVDFEGTTPSVHDLGGGGVTCVPHTAIVTSVAADVDATSSSYAVHCHSEAAAAAFALSPRWYGDTVLRLSTKYPELVGLLALDRHPSPACCHRSIGEQGTAAVSCSSDTTASATTTTPPLPAAAAASAAQPTTSSRSRGESDGTWPPSLSALVWSNGDVAHACAAGEAVRSRGHSGSVAIATDSGTAGTTTAPIRLARGATTHCSAASSSALLYGDAPRAFSDASTATPLHFDNATVSRASAAVGAVTTSHPFPLDSNEWTMRKHAAKLYRLTTQCATHSAQTDESSARRDGSTQANPPAEAGTQTRASTGTSTERTARVVTGARGATEAVVGEHAQRHGVDIGAKRVLLPTVVSITLPF